MQRRIEEALSAFGRAKEVMTYIGARGGKKLRPSLVMLTFDLCGGSNLERAIQAAAGVELVHMASLIHDDIIDHSELRRGQRTVHRYFGNHVAVLAGDHLFAAAFHQFSLLENSQVSTLMTGIIKEMCLAEINQVLTPLTEEDAYWDYIHKKTALLVGGCCRLGPMLSGVDHENGASLQEFGECIGLAFQLSDDVLDYQGNYVTMGKQGGQDFADGLWTLPIIRAYQKGLIPHNWKRLGYSAIQRILEREKILAEVLEQAEEYLIRAKGILSSFPPSTAKRELENILEKLRRRKA